MGSVLLHSYSWFYQDLRFYPIVMSMRAGHVSGLLTDTFTQILDADETFSIRIVDINFGIENPGQKCVKLSTNKPNFGPVR